MADTTMPEGNSAALAPDEGVVIPRISLKEQGFAALKTTNQGKIVESANQAFRFPQFLRTVAEMKYSPSVAVGLSAISTLMNKSEVTLVPLVGETSEDKARREFLMSVLHDMENSWQTTMQSIGSYKEYGHSVHEMVFRRRLKRNGSRYDDGLIGLAKLANRPQNSIARWNFADDGRSVVSISQSLRNMPNAFRFQSLMDDQGYIEIPREKFLLFRCDPQDDNPEGQSCLIPAFLAYKQLSLLTDNLMTGISKDIGGIPFAQLPPKYMDPNASPEDAAVYSSTKAIVDNVANGEQAGIIFPKMIDPDSKADLFSFSLLEHKSSKSYDVESVIKMLQANILAVLGAGSVTMGAMDAGSYSLQDSNTNILALTVAYRLSEVANTLNKELLPTLWSLNGWDTSRMPSIAFKSPSSQSLEDHSKWLQRVASVGLLELDRGVLNKIREVGGFEPKPDDEPIDFEHLSTTMAGKASSSSQGMAVGVGGVNGGTSTSTTGGKDNSTQNADNAS